MKSKKLNFHNFNFVFLYKFLLGGGGPPGRCRINRGIVDHSGGESVGRTILNGATQLSVNWGFNSQQSQNSDYELAFAAVWKKHLSAIEIKQVEDYLYERYQFNYF